MRPINSRLEEIIFGTRSDEMCDDRSGETFVTWIARQIRNQRSGEVTDHLQRLLFEISSNIISKPHVSQHKQSLRRALEITRLTNQIELIDDLVHLFLKLNEIARDEDRIPLQRLTLQTLAEIGREIDDWEEYSGLKKFWLALIAHPDFSVNAFEALRTHDPCEAVKNLDLLFMLKRMYTIDERRIERILNGLRRESDTRGYDLTESLAEFIEKNETLFSEYESLLRSTLGQDVLDRALEIRSEGEDHE